MGDDDRHPVILDLVGLDEREERPQLRIRLTADVLARAGPKDVVELVRRGVDEEVDRESLLDAEQTGRLGDRPLPDRERPPSECVAADVPMDADDLAGERPPLETSVLVRRTGLRSEDPLPVLEGDPPPADEGRVRQQRPERGVHLVDELDASRLLRADVHDEVLVLRERRRDEELRPGRRDPEGGDLLEQDPLPPLGRRRRCLEPDLVGADRRRRHRECQGEREPEREREREREQRPASRAANAPPHHGALHASPASRRIPIPFSRAPCRPSRTRVHPVAYETGIAGAASRTIVSARA